MKYDHRCYKMSSLGRGSIQNFPRETLVQTKQSATYVPIKVEYSSLNYKDSLALTGRGPILKSFPLIPGIDLAGRVAEEVEGYKEGEEVLATGCGLGESVDGGYQTLALVDPQSLIRIPERLNTRSAMIVGTAGFTAALCIHRMEALGLTPGRGPIVVTGASGGVGSLATHFLSELGHEVWAVSSKKKSFIDLQHLGASKTLTLEELNLDRSQPLAKGRFAGAIDNLGGSVLEGLVKSTQLWGSVCSVGLALEAGFQGSVMPHILRGVSLLGISSANCPLDLRQTLWSRLSLLANPKKLEGMVSEESNLEGLLEAATKMLEQKTSGRILVKLT